MITTQRYVLIATRSFMGSLPPSRCPSRPEE
jgi:hypothetical protein